MPPGRSRKFLVLAAAALGIAAISLFLYSAPEHQQPSPDRLTTPNEVVPAQSFAPAAPTPQKQAAGDTLTAQSPEELAQYIRRYAQTGGDPAKLYGLLGSLRLPEQPWWRNAEEVSALLDLATDASIAENYRTVAIGLYLASAPQAQLSANSASIQRLASTGSDSMASATLQGMAERSVAPASLTKEILASFTRGTGAKCHAWYAARLTQKNDPVLAGIALAAPDTGMTEASKVAFDYLASGAYALQYSADPNFQKKTDALLGTVQALPADSGPMGLANGDAFIRAIPSITPLDTAVDSLFALVQEAQNPDMRLSAIEQLVAIHLSGNQNLSQELHEVRNQIATLFSDPVKQDRAKIRLNRIETQRKAQ